MNENNISIKNDFFEFTEELFQQIEETEISLDNEICYLIKESWINKFINDKNKIDIKFPQFLYDFKDIISCIRDNQKFNFVKKQFINNYYSEKELKNTKFIKYYTGNNNIIIEFEKNKEKRALMIRNFTKEENKIENKSFIILLEDRYLNEKNKLKLFRKLLSSNKSDNNIIIPYRAYIILLNEFEEKYEKKIILITG